MRSGHPWAEESHPEANVNAPAIVLSKASQYYQSNLRIGRKTDRHSTQHISSQVEVHCVLRQAKASASITP